MKKKVVAAVMAGMMVMALGGCSTLLGPQLGEKKAISVFEDTLDAEEIDPEDLIESIEENDYEDVEDGVWAKMDKSDSKDAVKAMQLNAFMAEAKHVESSLVYLKTNPLYEEDRYAFFMTVLEFKDVDDADDFFDDTIDLWEETSDDVEFDDEDKLTQAYVCLEDDDLEVYAGVYKNGNKVLYVVNINAEDDLDDACEAFNVNSPTSVK